MSSTQELYRVRSKPSSSTTTALMLTYRPIIFLLFAGPALIMSLPLVAVIFRSVFGTSALVTIGMTAVLSKVLERLITNAAPTKEIAIKSLAESRGWLFFLTFATSVIAVRLIVVPLEQLLGLNESILKWSPSISISSSFRLALGGFLLGLSVVARYIGPQSIVRCSSSPLQINPYTKAFRAIFQIEDPNYSPKKLNQPGVSRGANLSGHQDSNPRRLQLPTSSSLSAQIVISIVVAIILAFTSVLPFAHDAATKTTIILSCITSSALQLLLTTIKGTNHEINPTRYQSQYIRNWDNFIQSFGTAVPISFAVPILAIFQNGSFQWNGTLVYFICVPPVIILYLNAFDYALRILICTAPSNMKKFVEEASGGDVSMEIFVDVILRSLLHSNDELVNKLGNIPTNSSMLIDIEEKEVKLNNASIKTMANTLLHKTIEDEASPHLEDDILRVAILSCIGGSVSKEGASIGKHTGPLSNTLQSGSDSIGAFAVPIVRALCAYVGGIGEALRLVASTEDKMLQDTWVLPPGALFMGECAIRGATHWILQGIDLPRSGASLTILIPVLLNSTYKLQNSLLRYSQATNGSGALDDTSKLKLSHTMSPQLLQLFNVCDNCSKIILKRAKANEGFRRLHFLEFLDADCQKWLRSKMSTLE